MPELLCYSLCENQGRDPDLKKKDFEVASSPVEISPAESAVVWGNASRGRGLVHADKGLLKPANLPASDRRWEGLSPAAQHVGGSSV